jgi:hypothetical protein
MGTLMQSTSAQPRTRNTTHITLLLSPGVAIDLENRGDLQVVEGDE